MLTAVIRSCFSNHAELQTSSASHSLSKRRVDDIHFVLQLTVFLCSASCRAKKSSGMTLIQEDECLILICQSTHVSVYEIKTM